ncbi:hypothetical protein QR680_010133 [Steinernema hermaphroditum]|uniref:F-box domain-containing protein n=1 Tax=Steinernema hermaphroditum TaxID=289476 RepID=A0AA39IMV8_9BILA|nr:hypothetical protein QR680_010133 [Steinernema hermaphroditum]
MDAVPYNFVDAVIELFDKATLDSLASEPFHPLWKEVVDTHHRNRLYTRVKFRQKNGTIQCIFENDTVPLFSIDHIQAVGRKFVRIDSLIVDNSSEISWDDGLVFEEHAADKMVQLVTPFCTPVRSCSVLSVMRASSDFQATILQSLYKKHYFTNVDMSYSGPAAIDFLEDHIENNRLMESIELFGAWPQSIFPLLRKFCFQTERRRHLRLHRTSCFSWMLDWTFIEEFFAYWRENGTFECLLQYRSPSHRRNYYEFMNNATNEISKPDMASFHYLEHDEVPSLALGFTAGRDTTEERFIRLEFMPCLCTSKEVCSEHGNLAMFRNRN